MKPSNYICGVTFVWCLVAQVGEGQTPPSMLPINGVRLYLAYEDRIIPDYSMIYASQFYDNDDGINDALWCQSASNSTNIGVWYYPNGTEVPLFDRPFGNAAPSPVFSKRFSGQIALARSGGLSGYEGLYKCIIPDENGVDQTLVVGAYTDTGYNNNDGPNADPTMQFSLLSTSRLATSPVFSLSFNVSNGPPTTVSCLVNGTGISTELSRVIVNGSGSVTRVTVTNLTEAGNYQCIVSNARVTNEPLSDVSDNNPLTAVTNTSSLNVSVSDTPSGLTAARLSTGLVQVRLSWSTVSGATGYEVYYQLSSNTPVSLSNTSLTVINVLASLLRESTYTFYVVSYGSASLPSGNASVMLTISDPVVNDFMATEITSTGITLAWSPPTAVAPISYNINRRCRRVCESSFTSNNETSVSSPHTSTGIPPYSQCGFDLIGVYGAEIANLKNNYLASTLLTAPTALVSDIIFSSVESVSMTVSWDEVPCNRRNGPITGYYLTYTNITSNTSYTVNITGGDNRMYNLTGLIPYTNYTVSIIPYNYNMNGPARQEIQLTPESIPGVISDLSHSTPPTEIIIVWNPPTIPNGIITVYEIRYRESTSTGPYNITNTTNTYYSIVGLIPNTSYTIGVRAYTSIGPGEWTDREYTTIPIPVIKTFSITKLNSTAVRAEWSFVSGASHYTVYYESTSSSSRKKRQVETGMRVFPGDTTEGLIGGLDPNLNYLFSISTSFTVNGIIYEGERTQPISPNVTLTPTAISNTLMVSTLIQSSGTSTPVIPTTTNGGSMTIVFIAVGAIVSLLLIVIIIVIITVVVLKKKRFKKDYDVVNLNNKQTPEQNLTPYSTAINNNGGYEEIGVEKIQESNYSTVMEPILPIIEEFPNDVTSEEGHEILFKVKFKGTPTPSFNWYHNGEPVTDDYAHELRGDGSLLLVSVEEKHKGTYRFVANNDAGTVSQQLVLTVAVEGARIPSNDTSTAKGGKNLVPVGQFGEFVANGHAKGNEGFRNQFIDQYIFVNDAVLESVTCGNTQVDSRNARIVFNRMSKLDTKTGQTGYEEQFTVLQQVTQRPDEVTHNIASQNNDKNRSTQFLPPNNYRVPLKNEHPDYINAVFINGYKEKKAFIIAESPMFNTARNFWKMIDDRNVTAIEVCYQYWPSTSSGLIVGEYNIALLNEEIISNGCIERKFELKHTNKTSDKQQVKQYQITNWDSTGKMTNPQTILLVIEEMYRTQRKRGNTSIVVHCSDTVGRSAMFCAAATTINKCKTEGVIDVFQVLKSQRIQKPGSVQTVQQYQGIFQIVLTYLDSFETYSNFTK
uniref:protein-tyrosine-phosphatase n=1 Tax=Amphimedon queenslandica TaxID=400682 RepID=A0A1X7TQK7_AMPQE